MDQIARKQSQILRNAELPQVVQVQVPIILPYDWETVLSYLKRHECFGIEKIANGRYMRFIPVGNSYGTVTVAGELSQDSLLIEYRDIPTELMPRVSVQIQNLFDTTHNPEHLPHCGSILPNGIRVPGSFDPLETTVSIILSQLVSTQQAKAKLKTLVQRFGKLLWSEGSENVFQFPDAEFLAEAPVEEIGITRTKAHAIREIAKGISTDVLTFETTGDFTKQYETLLNIKGIGPWTASMISMRCLRDPNAFPKADLIVQRAFEKGLFGESDWSNSRAYLTHCLWRDYGHLLSRTKQMKHV